MQVWLQDVRTLRSLILKRITELLGLFLNYYLCGRPQFTQALDCLLLFSRNTLSLREDMTFEDLSVSCWGQPQSALYIWGTEKALPLLNGPELEDELRPQAHTFQK